jgi:hypothetical protein
MEQTSTKSRVVSVVSEFINTATDVISSAKTTLVGGVSSVRKTILSNGTLGASLTLSNPGPSVANICGNVLTRAVIILVVLFVLYHMYQIYDVKKELVLINDHNQSYRHYSSN